MGGGASKELPVDMAEQLLRDMSAKILILGAGEAGKTTTCSQLHCIVNDGMWDPGSKKKCINSLRMNVYMVARKLAEQIGTDTDKLSDAGKTTHQALLQCDPMDAANDYKKEEAAKINAYWHEDAVKEKFANKDKFWILEWAPYYLDNAERFAGDDFEPTETDLVRARVKTTGVNQDPFNEEAGKWTGWEEWKETDLKIHWTVVDVGGQRSERRKWLGFFDNVQSVVFLVNSLGYNEVLYEDENLLRMHESLTLFDSLFGEKSQGAFNRIPVTVAFNKLDSFKESFSVDGMKRCFPDCPPEAMADSDSAMAYIQKVFVEKCAHRAIPINTHAFNAIERPQCETLLREVQKTIMDGPDGVAMLARANAPEDPNLKKALEAVKKGAKVPYDKVPSY